VALTFHVAGGPELASRALDVLARERVTVTVFAVGSWLASNPEFAPRILEAGHDLANHTYTHLPMRRLSPADLRDEIQRGADAIASLADGSGRWFRPSGTPRANRAILTAAGKVGYRHSIAFDVDPADYTDPGADAVASRVAATAQSGSIVSLHFGHAGTIAALPRIIGDLRARNLQPTSLSSLLGELIP